MAFPTILINSASGSDTAASGAGPSTALTGSAASTNGTGLVVTLDGSTDLSGVATDGSHVIYLVDSTAGARNFGKITAKDNSAKTVTVADAFGTSLSGKSWAIGGKRASIGGTNSVKLLENNSGNGDAMPGWIIQMESGHSEGSIARITIARSGNTTDGPIILQGAPGAATRPELRFANFGQSISANGDMLHFLNFDFYNSANIGDIGLNLVGVLQRARNLRVGNVATTYSAIGINTAAPDGVVENCEIQFSVKGLALGGTGTNVRGNRIHDCGTGVYINTSSARPSLKIADNFIYDNDDDGLEIVITTDNTSSDGPIQIERNTIHGNGTNGIEVASSSSQKIGLIGLFIANNQLTGNGAYAMNFSGSGVTDALLFDLGAAVRNNNSGSGGTANTSGFCNFTLTLSGENNIAVDPGYADASSADFSIGLNTRALGYPLGSIGLGSVRSYTDIGAVQHQNTGGGSGGVIIGN